VFSHNFPLIIASTAAPLGSYPERDSLARDSQRCYRRAESGGGPLVACSIGDAMCKSQAMGLRLKSALFGWMQLLALEFEWFRQAPNTGDQPDPGSIAVGQGNGSKADFQVRLQTA